MPSSSHGDPSPPRPRLLRGLPHLHLFRFAGEDAFSAHNHYRCRCGVVKPGL